MKYRKSIFFTSLLALSFLACAQSSDYPNVQKDYLEDQHLILMGEFRFQIPRPLGFGVEAAYFMPNRYYVSGNAGIGWTYKVKKNNTGGDIKYLAPWMRVSAGFPLHVVSKGSSKLVISQTNTMQEYYRIKTPAHNLIIPEVGFVLNPSEDEYLAPAITAGITWRNLVNVDARVVDGQTGRAYADRVRRYSHLSFGIIIPTKEMIVLDSGGSVASSTEPKLYLNFGFPYLGVTWQLGLMSYGYDNKALFHFGVLSCIR